jgi:hypothetical protein
MQRQCPEIKFSLADNSGLLQATCLKCGSIVGWSKHPKLLAIVALAHKCKTTTHQICAA